ncbi:MAG TPA: four-helix bundle copper-binding protein [Bacteroidales bacterium]|jgi:hypothetical protein|nr:four-helix bundle copper-binding protein [Bacteroidales bacterium]
MTHERFQSTIDALNECATECIHCANACLEEQDVKMLSRCIKLDFECADICILTAKMLAGDTEFHKEICEMCANICDTCAQECEKHSRTMDHCERCARVCHNCADECRTMISEKSNVTV